MADNLYTSPLFSSSDSKAIPYLDEQDFSTGVTGGGLGDEDFDSELFASPLPQALSATPYPFDSSSVLSPPARPSPTSTLLSSFPCCSIPPQVSAVRSLSVGTPTPFPFGVGLLPPRGPPTPLFSPNYLEPTPTPSPTIPCPGSDPDDLDTAPARPPSTRPSASTSSTTFLIDPTPGYQPQNPPPKRKRGRPRIIREDPGTHQPRQHRGSRGATSSAGGSSTGAGGSSRWRRRSSGGGGLATLSTSPSRGGRGGTTCSFSAATTSLSSGTRGSGDSPGSSGALLQRQPHTAVERKYREGLNAEMERLRQSVPTLPKWNPASMDGPPKPTKATVIASAIEYIRDMESECGRLRGENERLRMGESQESGSEQGEEKEE